ncbi:putative extracellular serine-rich protein [Aspergillus lucknowensis]|uniref:Extracellular serine-rich protein n=1 Tax=Aspergillus lucknowensis TaxID=176173 RepID=A0ABR4L8C8_9EURO
MLVPTFALRIGCFFGLLTCNTPPGEWPEDIPDWSFPGPPLWTQTSISLTTGTTLPPSSSTTVPTATEPADPTATVTTTDTTWTTIMPTFTSTTFTTSLSPSTGTDSTPVKPTTSMSSVAPSATGTLAANILVIARDATQAQVAYSGLNGYGIPYTELLVPQAGVELPALNTSSGGNFGGIVVAGEVSYDYGGDNWRSALTDDQWNQLYAYQLAYGVRMVQYDVYPGPNFGTTAVSGGCCGDGVEQLVSFSDVSDFPTSGLRTGAGVSTQGLWHYPASVSDTNTTKQIAVFAAGSGVGDESTAVVINNFSGRQQMVFFMPFDTVWSDTSNYLQHAWITWITRGLHAGYRRVNLNTQIDDMFLQTDIYQPAGEIYRISTADMDGISAWLPSIRAKLNPGSTYYVEIGHNGNGNIEAGQEIAGYDTCSGGAIEYDSPPDTPLEFKKPLGTGDSLWPATPSSFQWTNACLNADSLLLWFQEHLNEYGHVSHTFTHLEQNNATYDDVAKEISFNQAWLRRVGFTSATRFTSNGIIPPAITGLHNGDALRAWSDNGITNCVGDNTRAPLLNTQNRMWPYFTTEAADGFAGMQVNPRWATRIYYNCYSPACTTQEWIDTSAGAGDFSDLLAVERTETIRHLFGLSRDAYMFHQANLRNADVDPITVNGETGQFSIFQAWVETIVQEFVRLVDWPIVTTTHQEMSDSFLQRYRRDQCGYALSYVLSDNAITGVTLTANGNSCDAAIPITFPEIPADTHGFTTEQLGNDPVTVWAQLSGSPVTFSLASPIAL